MNEEATPKQEPTAEESTGYVLKTEDKWLVIVLAFSILWILFISVGGLG